MMDSTHRPSDAPEYRRCPDCGKTTNWDIMVWLDGRCYCPKCYEHRKIERQIRRIEAET